MDIHVIYGGKSGEHEVSVRSAKNIINLLNKEKYNVSYTFITKEGKFVTLGEFTKPIEDEFSELVKDTELSAIESVQKFVSYLQTLDNPIVIPCIHGTTGEDGQIQGFLKTLGIRFIGNDVTSSAVCFDKSITNDVLAAHGIPQGKYYVLNRKKYTSLSDKTSVIEEIFKHCGEVVYVKPASAGSSLGVTRATRENIYDAIEEAFKHDVKILVEEAMPKLELEVSVIGNENPLASRPGAYTFEGELDYNAKYFSKTTKINLPYVIPVEHEERLRKLAIDSYIACGCEGFARVDIFCDENFNFFVNEINTFPGMTPTSLAGPLWEVTDGTTYPEFLDKLIEYAISR